MPGILLYYDANGTDNDPDKMDAVYDFLGHEVRIPFLTAPGIIDSALLAALDAKQGVTGSKPIRDYAKGFINNAALWVKLNKALDDERHTFDISTASAATILAKLKLQLKAARAIIATAPQEVINEFHRERVLMGSTTALPFNDAAIDGMTTAECRICITAVRLAANQGLAIVMAAASLNE